MESGVGFQAAWRHLIQPLINSSSVHLSYRHVLTCHNHHNSHQPPSSLPGFLIRAQFPEGPCLTLNNSSQLHTDVPWALQLNIGCLTCTLTLGELELKLKITTTLEQLLISMQLLKCHFYLWTIKKHFYKCLNSVLLLKLFPPSCFLD